MALRESIRDLKDIQYNEKKKTEKKIQFENNIYKLIKKEFNNTTAGTPACRLELLKNKDYILNNITPKDITLYEASKIYNRILNELYKEFTTNNDKADYKKTLNNLYNELENYFIKYSSAAYNILQDASIKNDILKKYILLYPENKSELKQYYNKTIKLLHNEFSNDEEVEEIPPKKQINYSYLFITILKLLLFPIVITLGFGLSYKPNKRRK